MKKKRSFPYVIITRKQENTLKLNHPWVYEDEILESSGEFENGCLVDVFGKKENYLGTGLYSEHSKIRVRILDRNANETFQDAFFQRRVQYAIQYRLDTMQDQFSNCRLVHGEADGLPGLTIDRYENVLVSEIASFGIEQRKEVIYKALVDELRNKGQKIDGIYERNENELRKKEGLPLYKGWFKMEGLENDVNPIVRIQENGLYFDVDVENGQKTGYFLDQKYNRLAIRRLAKGHKVLECCTHTGSFALNAAKGGATYVQAIDISETALEMARHNAKINDLEVDFRQGDVFEVLESKIQNKQRGEFDLIILDPPAFTKSRKTIANAKNGYRKINSMAMRLLNRGGYLATCSCSHFMPTEEFQNMLLEAGKDANVQVKIVEIRHASYDHPVLCGVKETDYLKYFLVQIV